MKKLLNLLVLSLMALCSVSLASCGDDDDEKDGPMGGDSFSYNKANVIYGSPDSNNLYKLNLYLENTEETSTSVNPPITLVIYSKFTDAKKPAIASGVYKPSTAAKEMAYSSTESFISIAGKASYIKSGDLIIESLNEKSYKVSGTIVTDSYVAKIKFVGAVSFSQQGGIKPVE